MARHSRHRLTPEKAREILRHGTVHGKPLTERARRFMWVVAKRRARKRR